MTIEQFPSVRREMPANYEAEQALLGAILKDNRILDQVELSQQMFAEPVHGHIFAIASAMINDGKTANAITLRQYFEGIEALKKVGGASYLAELQGNCVSLMHAKDHARIVEDMYERRQVIDAANEALADAYEIDNDERSGRQVREAAEQRLADIGQEFEKGAGLRSMSEIVPEFMSQLERVWDHDGEIYGTSTGIPSIDKMTGGMKAPDLWILAGRPSMGKSAVGAHIAHHVAESHGPVAFWSKEMGADQVAGRLVSTQAKIAYKELRTPGATDQLRSTAAYAASAVQPVELYVDDTAGLTVPQIHARARRLNRRKPLKLLVIDYLQLLKPADLRVARYEQIGQMTRALKVMAKDLNVPVLVLAQLSRQVEQRENKRPLMSDLRESGDIENDADLIALLYREEYYSQHDEPQRKTGENDDRFNEKWAKWMADRDANRGHLEIIIAKHRNGPTGTAEARFNAATMEVSTW